MMKHLLVVAAAVSVLSTLVNAQEGGGGGFGGGGGGMGGGSGLPSSINAPRTIPQQFASKLKLDTKERGEVDGILAEAATEAAPHAQELVRIRQNLLNAALANRPDQIDAAEHAYAEAAAQISTIEAAAFAKVYALLKPNQQKEAPEAFALLAGLFSNTGGARGARGGLRGGRGRGGAR